MHSKPMSCNCFSLSGTDHSIRRTVTLRPVVPRLLHTVSFNNAIQIALCSLNIDIWRINT